MESFPVDGNNSRLPKHRLSITQLPGFANFYARVRNLRIVFPDVRMHVCVCFVPEGSSGSRTGVSGLCMWRDIRPVDWDMFGISFEHSRRDVSKSQNKTDFLCRCCRNSCSSSRTRSFFYLFILEKYFGCV